MNGSAEMVLTIWHRSGETANGCAVYENYICDGMIECHETADDAGDRRPALCMMTGFLFPSSGKELPERLSPGSDKIAAGTFGDSPEAVSAAGVPVYDLIDASRPARLSGGGMVDWYHFRASCHAAE